MAIGLGDYWKCLHRDQSVAAPSFMGRFDEFDVMDNAEYVPDDCADKWDLAIPMMLKNDLLNVLAWITGNREGGMALVSIYPIVVDGGATDMVVEGTTAWPKNLEGLVHARFGEMPISFFDALFPISRERYVVGETARFSLAAFGSSLHKLSSIAEIAGKHSNLTESITKVYETGNGDLLTMPNQEGIEDRYMLTGRLKHLQHETIDEMHLMRANVSLTNGLTIPLIFGETSIETDEWTPQEGDFIVSVIFLQGYREGLALHSHHD